MNKKKTKKCLKIQGVLKKTFYHVMFFRAHMYSVGLHSNEIPNLIGNYGYQVHFAELCIYLIDKCIIKKPKLI